MTKNPEAIIIGAGHNGLTTAALLAKSGINVLVLEQRDQPGGAAASEEIFPGFQFNTGSDDASLFQDQIVQELDLAAHGLTFLESDTAVFAPQPDGSALTLWRDSEKSAAEIGQINAHDGACYPTFAAQINRYAQALRGMMLLTPPELMERRLSDGAAWGRLGLNLRRMGGMQMMEFMRILPLPIAGTLDEWFASDALKGTLALPALLGNQLGVRGGVTTFMFLYRHTGGFLRHRAVKGGTGQLSAALAKAAKKYGAQIRLGSAVDHILLERTPEHSDRTVGVVLSDGTEISARLVISNADPRRTFLGLVGPTKLEPRFVRQVRNILYRGVTAKVLLALSGLPSFKGIKQKSQLESHIHIAPGLDYLERAYDDAKYGDFSANPVLDITIPTLLDPGLAPAGKHIMSITMQYAPFNLKDGNWPEAKERLGDAIINTLSQYAPDLPDKIIGRHILTPCDYQQSYGLTEGSIHHGQMSLDQLLIMRPIPGRSRYQTPIENLFLCGAGTHPGGGVTGAPGYNAAREVIKFLKG